MNAVGDMPGPRAENTRPRGRGRQVRWPRACTPPAPAAKRDMLIVFFHGGGFVGGDLDEADDFLRSPGRCDHLPLVLAPSYTLATVSPFPAAVEDAHAVLQWAKKNKTKLGWTGKQLVVAGIEAGANLAAVCALMSRDRGGPALAGQILIMPMLDPGLTTCSMRELHAMLRPRKWPPRSAPQPTAATCRMLPTASHPYASPLQSSRLKNLPPALILSAEDDPLRDEAEQYGAKLITCGVSHHRAAHGAAPTARPERPQ